MSLSHDMLKNMPIVHIKVKKGSGYVFKGKAQERNPEEFFSKRGAPTLSSLPAQPFTAKTA